MDAEGAKWALERALSATDAVLAVAAAALDPDAAERLSGALRAAKPYEPAPELPPAKTCQAPLRGMDRCGRPGAMMRCMEGVLLRGRCSDAP